MQEARSEDTNVTRLPLVFLEWDVRLEKNDEHEGMVSKLLDYKLLLSTSLQVLGFDDNLNQIQALVASHLVNITEERGDEHITLRFEVPCIAVKVEGVWQWVHEGNAKYVSEMQRDTAGMFGLLNSLYECEFIENLYLASAEQESLISALSYRTETETQRGVLNVFKQQVDVAYDALRASATPMQLQALNEIRENQAAEKPLTETIPAIVSFIKALRSPDIQDMDVAQPQRVTAPQMQSQTFVFDYSEEAQNSIAKMCEYTNLAGHLINYLVISTETGKLQSIVDPSQCSVSHEHKDGKIEITVKMAHIATRRVEDDRMMWLSHEDKSPRKPVVIAQGVFDTFTTLAEAVSFMRMGAVMRDLDHAQVVNILIILRCAPDSLYKFLLVFPGRVSTQLRQELQVLFEQDASYYNDVRNMFSGDMVSLVSAIPTTLNEAGVLEDFVRVEQEVAALDGESGSDEEASAADASMFATPAHVEGVCDEDNNDARHVKQKMGS